jgi:hypothetical protein
MVYVLLRRALELQLQRMVDSHDGSDMKAEHGLCALGCCEFEQRCLGQHEHELESWHPMTPSLFETRVCRYGADACQRPRGLN